ncbi:hypothetical protein VPIG_00116 [Vibrio phage PWH3a-P1]|uniref:hypothetical protein n=1 Tax=Vibrio phage PWH3a-P1 TaxID=754058 RepID=UPI0002C0A89C|nr:hypothetical protein VPIG_00116 [Vibrio phage PWH3a-P1]AGH31973.1 hypothetical protein VPIG_00116 [Vibrio phage PWH3a-P1]
MGSYKTLIVYIDTKSNTDIKRVVDLSPDRLGVLKQLNGFFGDNNNSLLAESIITKYGQDINSGAYQVAMTCIKRGKQKQDTLDILAHLLGIYEVETSDPLWDTFEYGYLSNPEFYLDDNSFVGIEEVIVTGNFSD